MMPLPMVHLQVAVNYMKQRGIKDLLGTFLLGNIAPDSIHMREGITKEDKPRTHFYPNEEGDYLLKLKKHYYTLMNGNEDLDWKWFVRGYFMHVITDYLWVDELYSTFKEQNQELGRTNDEIRTLYYKETDQVDFNIYYEKAWTIEVWELLKEARSYDFSDLLTSKEILLWRDRTDAFFNDPLKEPKIIPQFITNDLVNAFTDKVARQIGDVFEKWEITYIKF
ncbi:hypothetical protein ACP8HI_20345 [Paenibacillus sp. FA6]|uniref:hypothetical protein n=1 Tax=Paenibacillus sp. FA6 TaxID=3413029 RepID=UPI003F65C5C1